MTNTVRNSEDDGVATGGASQTGQPAGEVSTVAKWKHDTTVLGKSRFARPTLLVGALALLAAVAAGCSKKSPGAEGKKAADGPRAVTVTVAPVELRRDLVRTVDVVGSFRGLEEVVVTPKVSGRVIKIYHDEQDLVQTGELLLEIDPTDYQLAVDEAARAMASELAKIDQTSVPSGPLDVMRLPTVRRAIELEENALRKLRRAGPLFQNKTLTKEEYELIETEYRVSQATRQQVILDAQATLATARHKQAQLATAQQRLADTRVEVPAPKVAAHAAQEKATYAVADRMVEVGEMVGPAKGVFRLIINDTLKLLATVPERFVSQVKTGQVVKVTSESYPGKVFRGEVSRINPTVDPQSRAFRVEVLLANPSRLLKPGGFAELAIVTDTAAQALTVPAEALVTFAGVSKVFVVRQGQARAVEVTPGEEGRRPGEGGRAWVEVTPKKSGDLAAGEPVVTSGQTQLADGSAVQVREAGKK